MSTHKISEHATLDHLAVVRDRLSDLYEVDGPSGAGAVARLRATLEDANDDDEAGAVLGAIQAALGDEYEARWTGDGNGDESDIDIYVSK